VPAQSQFIPLLYAVVLVSNLAVTFLAMAVESLMVYGTEPAQHGRAAAGFRPATSGLRARRRRRLWMAEHLPEPWIAGAVLGRRCARFAPSRSFFVAEPPTTLTTGNYRRRLGRGAEGSLARCAHASRVSRAADLASCRSAAAQRSNLGSAVADDWHASADTVALVTGAVSGVVSAAGCLAGG
jgi:hypothetical protein